MSLSFKRMIATLRLLLFLLFFNPLRASHLARSRVVAYLSTAHRPAHSLPASLLSFLSLSLSSVALPSRELFNFR